MSYMKYFKGSVYVTILGLIAGGAIGFHDGGTWGAAFNALFLTFVLAVLEVSLSFDNAVVNATVLEKMTPKWQHRFLTWGILIAVFGMRLVLPVAIVSLVGKMGPWEALKFAAINPHEYARIMQSSHLVLAGFGGAFLLNVALKYFFDANKDVHWISVVERPLVKLGRMQSFDIAVSLIIIYFVSVFLPEPSQRLELMVSAIFGVVCYVAVDGLSNLLKPPEHIRGATEKASAAMFLYLEILDASFSFDGVIGAFALTHNLFIIAVGLGIGAMFVRSLTIMMTERKTLHAFKYLEHGAFYAIGILAMLMLVGVLVHIPEWITGLLGAVFIGLSLWSSIRAKEQHEPAMADGRI